MNCLKEFEVFRVQEQEIVVGLVLFVNINTHGMNADHALFSHMMALRLVLDGIEYPEFTAPKPFLQSFLSGSLAHLVGEMLG